MGTKKESRLKTKLFSKQDVISLIIRTLVSVLTTLITLMALGRFQK